MSIRFCEFCSSIQRGGAEYCPVCGARLTQETEEALFNDFDSPWPFAPVSELCLRIQGQPMTIRFSGTHSVYHLWAQLHSEYEAMSLYCRPRQAELELVGFPGNQPPEGYRLVDPGLFLNCPYRRFSFHTHQALDPEVAREPGEMETEYHGSFEIGAVHPKYLGNVLGWLAATAPRPAPENNWTYDI